MLTRLGPSLKKLQKMSSKNLGSVRARNLSLVKVDRIGHLQGTRRNKREAKLMVSPPEMKQRKVVRAVLGSRKTGIVLMPRIKLV